MPPADSYSAADVTTLNKHRTPIQKQPEALLCQVGLSRSYLLRDDVYGFIQIDQCPESHQGEDRDSTTYRLRGAATDYHSKLCYRYGGHGRGVVREPGLAKEVAALGPPVNKRHQKRGNNKAEANALPKVLRHDHAAFRPA
ncbi:hypothetical protein Tco_1444198 [Tanacetum coccineum]